MQHHLFDSRFECLRQVNLKGTAPLTVVIIVHIYDLKGTASLPVVIAIHIYDWKGTVDVV